jgi:hypothetical protein
VITSSGVLEARSKLAPVGGLARHRIDAVDRNHGQNLRRLVAPDVDPVFVAGLADDVMSAAISAFFTVFSPRVEHPVDVSAINGRPAATGLSRLDVPQ